MAWGHIPRPTRAHYRPDYHSAERHAATKTYSHYTRGQIASGALGPGTAAAQAAAHKWFTHTAWKNHRDAVVAAHKALHAKRLAEHRSRVASLLLGEGNFPIHLNDPVEVALGDAWLKTYNASPKQKRELNAAVRAAQGQADALWKVVGKRYGGGKRPGLEIGTGAGHAGEVTYANKNVTRVEREMARLATRYPDARDRLSKVLLHEWAHTRQPSWRSKTRTEGGAEALANDVARSVGLADTHAPTPEYSAYEKAVRKALGKGWIHHGQFMGP